MSEDAHRIQSGPITTTIKAQGAELCSLKDVSGVEFVRQAGRPGRATRRCCFRPSDALPMTNCGISAKRTA